MPYKIDLFAVFIFLGIVQAIFLSVFFLSKGNRQVQTNFFFGLMLLCLAACILEIFLMYTGYIIHCLYLVDFSEPLAFAIGPLLYLMTLTSTRGSVKRHHYWHLVFPFIYLILVIPYFILPEDVKFNCWVSAYSVDLPHRPRTYETSPRIFWVTDHHTLLVIISFILYAILVSFEVYQTFRAKRESFFKPQTPLLKGLLTGTIQILIATVLILIIKYFNPGDTGDHIFAAYFGLIIYMISFRIMGQSGFFKATSAKDLIKYKNSTITNDQQQLILQKLNKIMIDEKPFLLPDFSLPELAQRVGASVHAVSQVINERLGKSFFEMTAEYRINEAKLLLQEQKNIKVEEIAQQVGYNSKTSFNNAFKRLTGKTPSEFRAG